MKSLISIATAAVVAVAFACGTVPVCQAAADTEQSTWREQQEPQKHRAWRKKGPYRTKAAADHKADHLEDQGYETKCRKEYGCWFVYFRPRR